MDIRNAKQLKQFAGERVAQCRQQRKLVLIYAGILTGMAVLVALLQSLLDMQISKTGGLGSMGIRSVLSTVKTVLPVLEKVVSTCLSLGYLAAMMRVARGQFASPKTLRLGFDRFWVLLRKTLLEGLIYLGVAMAAMYIAMFFYFITPLFQGLMEVLTPMLSENGALDPYSILADAAAYEQIMEAMTPYFFLFLGVFCLAVIPIAFRYRMADFVLIDHPEKGAFAVLRESRRMMRGNCLNLLRVDLNLWWYYLGMVLITVVGYGDVLLSLLGVSLPLSGDGAYYLFLALHQILQFGLCVWLRNWVETTYALSYDAIRPQEPQNGVVLGNIFQM